MKKAVTGLLVVILTVGLFLVVAGRVTSRAETIYTVPQVLDSLPALRGRTVLVRGYLRLLYAPPQKTYYAIRPDGKGRFAGYYLPVLPAPQDSVLALLRHAHLLGPFPPRPGVNRVWRVHFALHAPSSCPGLPDCPTAVLLDTLR